MWTIILNTIRILRVIFIKLFFKNIFHGLKILILSRTLYEENNVLGVWTSRKPQGIYESSFQLHHLVVVHTYLNRTEIKTILILYMRKNIFYWIMFSNYNEIKHKSKNKHIGIISTITCMLICMPICNPCRFKNNTNKKNKLAYYHILYLNNTPFLTSGSFCLTSSRRFFNICKIWIDTLSGFHV